MNPSTRDGRSPPVTGTNKRPTRDKTEKKITRNHLSENTIDIHGERLSMEKLEV